MRHRTDLLPHDNPLQELRLSRELSVKALSEATEREWINLPRVSRATITRYEALPRLDAPPELGESVCLHHLVRICDAMDVPVELRIGDFLVRLGTVD